MKLAKNETYKIAFWAQKSETGIYGTSDLSAVTVDYSKIAINNDNADAFCAARLVTVTGSLSQTVYLYRPLAQINIGTNDLAAYEKSVPTAKKNLTATITLPVETPNKLNVIGGTESEGVVKSAVTGTTTEEVVFTTAPDYVMSGQTLTSSNVDYSYLTMLYVLAAPGKETMTFKAKLNNGTTDVSDLTVSNMPYQANYRTNIVGQLLTGSFKYLVEIEEGFYADYEKLVAPSFSTLADLNAYLAGLKEGTPEGDNGDINPEQVVLTAMGAVTGTPKIVLPKIHGDVDIRLAFEYDGTVDMVYAEGATDAQKPANIFFYAQKLNTLQATVPASHFELLSGSVVTNKAIVATNTNTFVIQNGARVGTAEIQKGNAHIAGTVGTVSVPTGATADGTNPVQVFLEKVASVDQIELKAQADVVVEQPKDQITKDETERKVAVYVNEGADNSTAKAQNGGVIYVKADVPCTVTVDGTSEAEDGTPVSSTVIIEDGAGGSTVTAENGGAINLTANDDCAVVSQGSSDDPTPVPSNVTVTTATADVSATTTDSGTVTTTTESADHVAVVDNGVAMTGGKVYKTLQAAIDACVDGGIVEILKDINLTTVSSTINGESNIKYNVVIQGKGLTLKGNDHAITASSGKRPLALAGNGKEITVKDLTINANGGTDLWLIANNMVATLDNVVVDGTNCTESYNQVVTIGSDFTGIELNVINGSVIKTNDDGTAHYDIIVWSPSTINVNNSTLKGWANVYLKPNAGGSVVNISNSYLQSKGYSGNWNSFGMISVECANNTITLDNVNAHSISSGDTDNALINASQYWASQSGTTAYPNKFYILNNTTFEGDGTQYTGLLVSGEWSYFAPDQNVFYFDESTKSEFEQYFPEGCVVTGPEAGLYAVNYISQILYYWETVENQYQGTYCNLSEPFTNGWLSADEFIELKMDVTLTADIECLITEYLPVNTSFTMTFGDYSITKGNYSIKLPTGISAVTDKETDVFTATDDNARIVMTPGENKYTYAAVAND